MQADIAVDAYFARIAVDLDAAEIEHKAVNCRAVDLVGLVRRLQRRRAPEHGFAQRRGIAVGKRPRRPVADPGKTGKIQGVFRVCGGEDTAALKPHLFRTEIELCRSDACQLIPQLRCRKIRRAGGRAGKAARIIPGGDRPGVPPGIERGFDPYRRSRQPEHIADGLRRHSAMPLPLWQRINDHRDAAERIDCHCRRRLRPTFRAGSLSLLRGQHGRDVAHIRDRRLDDGRETDAVEPARRARLLAPPIKRVEPAFAYRLFNSGVVIAGIEHRAGRAVIGKPIDQIAPDDIERIEAERHRDVLYQPFQREINLRPAKPPHEPARRLVCHDDAVADCEVRYPIGARHIAVHAVERRRLGGAQIGAAIFELVPIERRDDAVFIYGRGQCRDPVRRRGRGRQMFEPCLDPFDRPPGFARRQRHQHDVRKDRVLRPKAAAGIGRRFEAQPVPRNPERQRHDRVHRQGPLEIRGDLVSILTGQVLGDHDKGFERRAGIARIAGRDRNAVRRHAERRRGIAIAKGAVADDVRTDGRMQQRRIRQSGGFGIEDGRQRPILDRDPFERVLGLMAILRQHDRDRLPDIPHPVDREAPMLHRGLDGDRERLCPAPRVLAGYNAGNTGHRQRGRRINRNQLGMAMGRAQDRGLQYPARLRQIVGKTAAPAQQIGVFDARRPLFGPGITVGSGRAGHRAPIVGSLATVRQAASRGTRPRRLPFAKRRRFQCAIFAIPFWSPGSPCCWPARPQAWRRRCRTEIRARGRRRRRPCPKTRRRAAARPSR